MVRVSLVATTVALVEGSCTEDLDCSLNGICKEGTCRCDEPWSGTACDLLDILPTLPDSGYNGTLEGTSSWGGSIVQGEDGKWHMFVSEISDNCGLLAWKTNSQIVRAEADGPLGPYKRAEVVVPLFAHNPTVRRVNDTWLMYHIGYGDGKTAPRTDCTGGFTPVGLQSLRAGNSHFTMVRSAKTLTGPWTSHGETLIEHPDTFSDPSTQWTTNPAPWFADDGVVWFPWRNPSAMWPQEEAGSERLGMAKGVSAYGPFTDLTPTAPIFSFAIEDPYLWIDVRGNFHMLTHKKDKSVPSPERTGSVGHAFSEDGVSWRISANSPVDDTILLVDGTSVTVKKIARPQLLVSGGVPKYLTLGATAAGLGDHTTTVVLPLKGSEASVV